MKPASPAQLAARKRFAAMARSGAFKKTAKRKANPAIPMANSDLAMITEIKLFAENDYDLYRQQGKPIIDNLAKKMAKGQFDPAKAVKLYGYLADSAVKKYSVEHMGKRTPTLTILNKNDRELLAQQLFEAYAEEIADAAKQYAPKRNPAKKTVSQKVSQLVHEGYPQRQAVAVALSEQRAGKVKRNPSKRTYEVYCQSPGMNIHSWTKLAIFYSAEKAKQYAKTYAKAYPTHYVRVESHG